ncbi:hypothetical protein SAMN04487779_101511 [Belnapia rosea]|uniref:Uncharacterized protein n=1 Tax=Belnapia rosea TaxID=938405 RepID=A0A1G6YTZ1_9PROT|nr:hypothetical protein SAMN04487779_101511 [Belnapia rosea]
MRRNVLQVPDWPGWQRAPIYLVTIKPAAPAARWS